VAIGRDKQIELLLCFGEKLAVFQVGPTKFVSGLYGVAGEVILSGAGVPWSKRIRTRQEARA